MSGANERSRFAFLLNDIDLPDGAYERAERRYQDLADWISRPESTVSPFDAHIFVQGSFALGTAIRPVNPEEEYDLDFSCVLREGVTRDTCTQSRLKEMIGLELEAYRTARGIKSALGAKRRCWRLSYQDNLAFHMDVVPALPADDQNRALLVERMAGAGMDKSLAEKVARRAVWITDDQHADFHSLSRNWPSSNPGGYQRWFLSRMEGGKSQTLTERAQVDPVPVYRAREPLQQTVQLLKRHRDVMFAQNPDLKPASILITTLAGQACVPGEPLEQTLSRTLALLRHVRNEKVSQILNPINPAENFADRWSGNNCPLRRNFYGWIDEALRAFEDWRTLSVPQRLIEVASDDFAVTLRADDARAMSGGSSETSTVRPVSIAAAPAPWRH